MLCPLSPLGWEYHPLGPGPGMTAFTITPSGSQAKCLLPVPLTLCSAGLEVLVPKRGMLLHLPGDSTMIPQNWKLGTFWAPHAS